MPFSTTPAPAWPAWHWPKATPPPRWPRWQPLRGHVAAGGTLDGTEYPRLIELTCHQALARAGDPFAADWLARAHSALMAQADAIGRESSRESSQQGAGPALRHGFLSNIPHHREIVAAWAKREV